MVKFIFLLIASMCGLFAQAGVKDLDMFGLKGPVDSICIIMNDAGLEWQNEFTFDEHGMLVELDGMEVECTRDELGRMKTIIVEDVVEDNEDAFTTIEMHLFYDNAGRVVKVTSMSADETWTQNYRYHHNGNLKERDPSLAIILLQTSSKGVTAACSVSHHTEAALLPGTHLLHLLFFSLLWPNAKGK